MGYNRALPLIALQLTQKIVGKSITSVEFTNNTDKKVNWFVNNSILVQ